MIIHQPNVAVLLAAYNGKQWIQEQVNSILKQLGVRVTIYISVDLSTDGTYEWVKEQTTLQNNIILLPYGRRFGGAGPNFFHLIQNINFDGFDAIAFSDQDDIWFDDKLLRACNYITNDKCDAYSSNVLAFWPNGKKVLIEKSQPQKKLDHFFEAAGPGCTYVFKAHAAIAFQNFLVENKTTIQSISLHDWLAYAFCRDRGLNWLIDNNPSMLYRQHENNQLGTNNNLRAYTKRLKLVKERWYRQQVEEISELVNPAIAEKLRRPLYRIVNFMRFRRSLRDTIAILIMFLCGLY